MIYSSDEENGLLQQRSLPVGVLEAGATPQDGLQYLSFVQSESAGIPNVLTADRSLFPDSSVDTNEVSLMRLEIPRSLIDKQMRKFSEFRQYCSRMRQMYSYKISSPPADETIFTSFLFATEPDLAFTLSLTQSNLFDIIVLFVEEILDKAPQRVHTTWLFSLFSIIEKPIPRDYMAILRLVHITVLFVRIL